MLTRRHQGNKGMRRIAGRSIRTKAPSHFRVMFGPALKDSSQFPSLFAASVGAFAQLVNAMNDCREAGCIREAAAEGAVWAAWSMIHGLSSLLVDGRFQEFGLERPRARELAEKVTSCLLMGLQTQV